MLHHTLAFTIPQTVHFQEKKVSISNMLHHTLTIGTCSNDIVRLNNTPVYLLKLENYKLDLW